MTTVCGQAMTSSPTLAPPAKTTNVAACRRCGGSGILRLADGRFRTCLDCLGLGITPAVTSSVDPPRVSGSAHPRSLGSPDEEGSRAHDRGQRSGGQQQEKDGGPVCVHP
jgi:hypothetical protein